MRFHAIAASAVLMAVSAPAMAGNITLTSLTTAGAGTTTTGNLVLTPDNTTFNAGAGYLNTALSLGAGANFEDSFSFSIASPSKGPTANGFAFFLATSPAGIGTNYTNLGLTTNSPLAVEFYDFGNKFNNPPIGGGLYNSNLVAAITGGNTDVVANNQPGSYGSPGGVVSCTGKVAKGSNCLNDGDVWTADVKYIAGKLYVTVDDTGSTTGPFTIIDGLSIALAAGSYYTGFSGSTGGSSDSVTVSQWSQNVPEPMTVGLFGAGLAALGFAKGRRRAA